MFGSHQNHIHYFRTLKGVVGMLRDPEHTESVFDIEDGPRDIDATRHMLEHLRKDDDVAAMIDSRWLAPDTHDDMDRLQAMPVGTLGRTFADHIASHGFDPDYYRRLPVTDDATYVMMRIRQTHDIWHCITGFDVDRVGEIALKAFELAQLRRPMAAVICAGGVMRFLLKTPDELDDCLRAISWGYRTGLGARPLLAHRFEEQWERPLAEWRAMLDVDPERHDPDRMRA